MSPYIILPLVVLAAVALPLALAGLLERRSRTWREWEDSDGFVAVPLLATVTLAAVLAGAHLWVPIAVVVLSSVLTGLTAYPQASGAVSVLRKLIALLSLVEHYDGPGSLKLPLLPAQPPPVLGSSVKGAPPRGIAILVILLIVGAVALIGGSVAVVATGHADAGIGQVLVDCTEKALESQAIEEIPQVQAILSGSSPDWAAQLAQLEASVGDGVLCAVQAIVSQLERPADGGMAALSDHDRLVLLRAHVFLEAQRPRVPRQ